MEVRRIHVFREENIWAEGYCMPRLSQNHGIANTCVSTWDSPGDFWESSFQEMKKAELWGLRVK